MLVRERQKEVGVRDILSFIMWEFSLRTSQYLYLSIIIWRHHRFQIIGIPFSFNEFVWDESIGEGK